MEHNKHNNRILPNRFRPRAQQRYLASPNYLYSYPYPHLYSHPHLYSPPLPLPLFSTKVALAFSCLS